MQPLPWQSHIFDHAGGVSPVADGNRARQRVLQLCDLRLEEALVTKLDLQLLQARAGFPSRSIEACALELRCRHADIADLGCCRAG
jgi:hypothetical protein